MLCGIQLNEKFAKDDQQLVVATNSLLGKRVSLNAAATAKAAAAAGG